MDTTERQAHVAVEIEALKSLASKSNILTVEATIDRPDRAELQFHGGGLARGVSANAVPTWIDSHRIELRLPLSFPDSPPDVRWLTPIFHPNVSYSGLVNLKEIGLEWSAEQQLASIVERLWDVARCAFLNLDSASNHPARNWFQSQRELELPIDVRTLRDQGKIESPQSIPREENRDILFIDEDTPTPNIPVRIVSSPGRRRLPGDDVLYIGDE